MSESRIRKAPTARVEPWLTCMCAQFSMRVGLCMCADGHSADRQLGYAFEDLPDALRLVVELAVLRGGEFFQRLHRDRDLPAGAALVPDPGCHPVDEQHGEVSCLAAGQRAFGGSAREDQLAWLAADRVGVEVGQQPYALGCRG